MLDKFKKHLSENFSFLTNKRLFLAVSGGIDSMVMLQLFMQLDFEITIVHCNFNLRGKESRGDQKFVEDFANAHDIPRITGSFDTKNYAKDYKVSIQVAARQLRYEWFNEQLDEKEFDYVLTAHNADDVLETFIINLSRGTGLEGLTGIAMVNGRVVRPFLLFTRKEIEHYADQNNITWREDSSNASDKYLRNKIRHHITPLLKELNPSFTDSFSNTIQNLNQSQSLVEDAVALVYNTIVTGSDNQRHINIQNLKSLPNYRAYLYQWLSPFGFTAWEDIYNLIDAQSGKYVTSEDYRLLKDRQVLILEALPEETGEVYEILENVQQTTIPIELKLENVAVMQEISTKNIIFVNNDLIKFPLFVRRWQEGDYFYPAGMGGLKKKVSKYFKDEKMSLSEKENTWLLCSGTTIVWIIGRRADHRFTVKQNTTQILKIEATL